MLESRLVWLLKRKSKALNCVFNNVKGSSTRVLNQHSSTSLTNPSRFFSSVAGHSTSSTRGVTTRNSIIYGFRSLHRHHKGLIGWWMVKSGLEEPPSEYHNQEWRHKVKRLALPVSILVGITAVSGAFVAGNDAGHAFNTFQRWVICGFR
ncbi:Cytochrome c oxidase assembly protein COX15 [Camellia lanceoleosa]|uniref:Cytochrome c oxidase assembly protein COX15 n=1 Tax=Camellia lanceoleosa TaxID=1840588 RepID=A0ACC0HBD8_9ERIC|nr:Cytochrome c oxidase assembly protein COX15 [Camellia lanceoleosa]